MNPAIDRLPPHAAESEMAIIGACSEDPVKCITEASETITTPEFFYDLRCQIIWKTMLEMDVREVNTVTLYQSLKDKGLIDQVGLTFIFDCQQLVPSTANLPVWIRDVEEKFILRRVIATATLAVAAAYENKNAEEVLDTVEREILKIRPVKHEAQTIRQLLQQATNIIEQKAMRGDAITGISTGLTDLDRLSDGLHNGELIVVAALPSCGKTAFAAGVGVHNALAKIPTAILSAEMRPVQLVVRAICSESRVNLRGVTVKDVEKMAVINGQISKSPIHIEPVSGMSIGQIRALARRLKQQHGIRLLVLDYIQLITGPGDNREQQVASVGRGMKSIALELDIPVIALSQLNDDGRLRESRAIGQDADSVWMLENEGPWQPQTQQVKLTIQKSRDGETGMVNLTFLKTITRFEQSAKVDDRDVPNHHPD